MRDTLLSTAPCLLLFAGVPALHSLLPLSQRLGVSGFGLVRGPFDQLRNRDLSTNAFTGIAFCTTMSGAVVCVDNATGADLPFVVYGCVASLIGIVSAPIA